MKKDINKIASWGEFLLFLALHDIGKGIAKENESFAFGTKLSFKEGELETTQKILSKIMELIGLNKKTICVFCEMLRYDTQGLYLPGDIQLEEAFDNILEMANNCQKVPSVFYRLFRAFHLVDAASYPSLKQYFEFGTETIEYCSFYQEMDTVLADNFEQAEKGKIFFEECLDRVHKNDDPNTLHHDFLVHLPEILKFLETIHKEMLAYPKQQEAYRKVKRGFSDILLYFAKTTPNIDSLKESYPKALEYQLGRDFQQSSEYRLDYFFDNASEITDLLNLKDKLMNFRKDYLCRYSLKKVSCFVQKEMDAISSGASKLTSESEPGNCPVGKLIQGTVIDSQTLALLAMTYLHGTNSAILPIFLKTGMQLMPFERLQQERIFPLREGSGAKGNNQYRISGTSLDHGMEIYTYASQKNLPSISPREEQEVITFLHDIEECIDDIKALFDRKDPSSELVRLSQTILRLRALDPELYKAFQAKLAIAVQKIETDWQITPRADMPKMDESIQYLKMAIDENLLIPQGILGALRLPYSMVLASNTLHTMASNLQNPSDRSAQKASLLGKDIQVIFTDKENEHRLSLFLKENGLVGRVSLLDVDILPNVILLNQLASPYFADIVSKRKLAKMVSGMPRTIHSLQLSNAPSTTDSFELSIYTYLGLSIAITIVAVGIFRKKIGILPDLFKG